VSSKAHDHRDAPHGAAQLPRDLTAEQLVATPVLAPADALLIDELSDDEDDSFAAAIRS
jgi:hypothetical protein